MPKADPASFYSLLGREVVERYGRFRCRVVGVDLTPDGAVGGIAFEHNGSVVFKPMECVRMVDGRLEVAPPPIVRAEELATRLDVLRAQFEAAMSLKDEVGQPFEHIVRELDDAFAKAADEAASVTKSLEDRRRSLESRISRLRRILFSIGLAWKLGVMGGEEYGRVRDAIRGEISRLEAEVRDIDSLLSRLASKLREIEKLREGSGRGG